MCNSTHLRNFAVDIVNSLSALWLATGEDVLDENGRDAFYHLAQLSRARRVWQANQDVFRAEFVRLSQVSQYRVLTGPAYGRSAIEVSVRKGERLVREFENTIRVSLWDIDQWSDEKRDKLRQTWVQLQNVLLTNSFLLDFSQGSQLKIEIEGEFERLRQIPGARQDTPVAQTLVAMSADAPKPAATAVQAPTPEAASASEGRTGGAKQPFTLSDSFLDSLSGKVQRKLLKAVNGKGHVKIDEVLAAVYGSKDNNKLDALLKGKDRINQTLAKKDARCELHREGETLILSGL